MANPFEKRATEFLRDDEAGFLSLVSPEPLRTYLGEAAKKGQLFEILIRIIGTPGSGKTTMATLLEANMVASVLAEREKEDYGDIALALEVCGIVVRGKQVIAATRLPLEGEYRDFWELPYSESLRTGLVMALVQARAVLGLVRNLERRLPRENIRFKIRQDAGAALEEIGGPETDGIVERARAVERAVYRVGASLVPLREQDIDQDAVRPFRPFDVIEGVEIIDAGGDTQLLKPLMILDDAHNLAPEQLEALQRDLARREIRVARWLMMRLDALAPEATLSAAPSEPAIQFNRDIANIYFQPAESQSKSRTAFRSVTKSMADRYLRRHPTFERRPYRSFSTLLSVEPPRISNASMSRLSAHVETVQEQLGIAPQRRSQFEEDIDRYVVNSPNQDTGEDVRLAMLRILMHRYANRVPQRSLFGSDDDPEPSRELSVDAGLAHGARIHLRHEFNRPLHYGLETVSDASGENAELFLHLAAGLVDRMETRIINGDPPLLTAEQQDRILSARATQIIESWNFPFAAEVRQLVAAISGDCLTESLTPNAWLNAGPNAIGILQEDFDALVQQDGKSQLPQILHYAVAYNAILLRRRYPQGGKEWCLLELGGPVILRNGLTLFRGGFLRRNAEHLLKLVSPTP